MNKREYLNRLGELIACLPAADVREAQAFYAEAIEDRMAEGLGEEEAVAALGAPGAAAEAILDSLPAVPRVVAKTRRRSTALLWTLAVLGSPLWLTLFAAFLAAVAAVYITIWAMAACLWIIALGTGAAGCTALLAMWLGASAGYWAFFTAYAGVGLALVGAGVLLVMAAARATRQLAGLSVLWVRKAWSFFRKDADGASALDDAGMAPQAA